MLNYNKLKYFSVVARHLNMTKAAEELYVGQPSLSVHIKELEKELGVPLFIRTNRNLELTDAGQLLYSRTASFFDSEDELIRAVRKTALRESPHVTIGVIGANVVYQLPHIIERFKSQYEDVEVKVLRLNCDPLFNALCSGVVDVGFQFNTAGPPEEFSSYILARGKFLVAMPKSHPLAKKKSVRISDLKDCKFVILNREQSSFPHDEVLECCRKTGFKPNIIAEYTHIETLLTMVNMGEAITLTSSLAPFKGLENIHCVYLEGVGQIELAMLWHKDNLNTAVQLFIQCVIDSYSNND